MELDRHLSFEPHVKRLCAKVSQRTGLLWHIPSFISTSLAKQLYVSLIDPQFLYSDYVYDSCNETLRDKLQVSQNRAVLKADSRSSATEHNEALEIEWLHE